MRIRNRINSMIVILFLLILVALTIFILYDMGIIKFNNVKKNIVNNGSTYGSISESDIKKLVEPLCYFYGTTHDISSDGSSEFLFVMYTMIQNKEYEEKEGVYLFATSKIDDIMYKYFGITDYVHRSVTNFEYSNDTKQYSSSLNFDLGPIDKNYKMNVDSIMYGNNKITVVVGKYYTNLELSANNTKLEVILDTKGHVRTILEK